jgi:hypothetical protein
MAWRATLPARISTNRRIALPSINTRLQNVGTFQEVPDPLAHPLRNLAKERETRSYIGSGVSAFQPRGKSPPAVSLHARIPPRTLGRRYVNMILFIENVRPHTITITTFNSELAPHNVEEYIMFTIQQ